MHLYRGYTYICTYIFLISSGYPDHEIKIGINSLGRERLLEDIAQRYGEKILVSQEKFEQLQLLDCLDVFTTDPTQSRIHTFSKNKVSQSHYLPMNLMEDVQWTFIIIWS